MAEAGSVEAAALLDHGRLGAPAWWLGEASNALWAKAMRRQLTPDEARKKPADLAEAPVVSIALPGLLPVAMKLALELEQPIYDCFYLSAAMQKDTHVVRRIGGCSRKPQTGLPGRQGEIALRLNAACERKGAVFTNRHD